MESPSDAAMLPAYDKLAVEISNMQRQSNTAQLLIGIAGPPAAGKSTLSKRLAEKVPDSIVLPMDGYHYTKARLQQFDDPEAAFKRRGAHWTFDAERFVRALSELKESKCGKFPAFEHGVGDPVEDAIEVTSNHRVVFVEGNYLTIDVPPWDQIVSILDWIYFVECDLPELETRMLGRCLSLGKDPEVSKERIATNDSPNALFALASKHRANAVIHSL